ncbi:hypothetical protein, partial [Tetragenococcus solitarius]|uniref:hypothetical protein n=1 Tax=Tetragenococcus solitarius TaxID=71453 RepID=UPI0031E0368E
MNVSYSISDIASRVIFTEIVPNNQLEKYNGTKSIVDNWIYVNILDTFFESLFSKRIHSRE